jgi:hypothetical protein
MRTRLTIFFLLVCAVGFSATSDPPPFRGIFLPHGISLDLPTTWIGFSPAMKAQIEAASQAAADLSGLDYDVRQLNQLLDIRQPLTNSYARLIISVGLGERLTQAQVKALTTPELRELESEYKKNIEAMATQMTLRVIEWHPLERRDINDKTYFVVRYVRSSPTAGQSTYIEMCQLHDTDKSVNFSIEYRLADKVLWDAVCRRSLTSLRVGNPEQKQDRLSVFRSAPHKFKISFPAGWQPLPKLGARMVVHVGGRIGEHTASMNAIVSEDESFRVMKTEDYLKTVKQKDFLDIASMSMDDVKMHRWEPKYEVGGQAALMFIYSGVLDSERQSTLTAQTIKDGRLYTVAFNAPADDFLVIYLELKHILDSFRFTE